MHRHLSSLAHVQRIAIALIDKVRNAKASPQQHAGLTILRIDQILRRQSGRAANVRRFLAAVGHVERDATLALRFVQDLVHGAQQHHVAEYLRDDGPRQLRILRALQNGTVRVHHTVDGHLGDAARQRERGLIGERCLGARKERGGGRIAGGGCGGERCFLLCVQYVNDFDYYSQFTKQIVEYLYLKLYWLTV